MNQNSVTTWITDNIPPPKIVYIAGAADAFGMAEAEIRELSTLDLTCLQGKAVCILFPGGTEQLMSEIGAREPLQPLKCALQQCRPTAAIDLVCLLSVPSVEKVRWMPSPAGLPNSRPFNVLWNQSHSINRVVDDVVVISLAHRQDRRSRLLWNFGSLGIGFRFSDAIRPNEDEILWREMRHLEAYHRESWLRTDYVIGAVGCKRSAIAQMHIFLESRHETLLLAQDDCELRSDSSSVFEMAWRQLPDNWDMLYLGASCRKPATRASSHLLRLNGARHCTAVIFRRRFVERILGDLITAGTELDRFLEQTHSSVNAFCIDPMIARQIPGHSDITRSYSENHNNAKATGERRIVRMPRLR